MDYTEKQYEIIELLEAGLIFDEQSHEIKEILCYLQDQGIANPKAYIAVGYYELSEDGKRILQDHRLKELVRAENVRREQEEKQQKLEQIAADKAEHKAEQRAERIFQIFLAFLQSFLSFTAGILVEHFIGISELIINFFG